MAETNAPANVASSSNNYEERDRISNKPPISTVKTLNIGKIGWRVFS